MQRCREIARRFFYALQINSRKYKLRTVCKLRKIGAVCLQHIVEHGRNLVSGWPQRMCQERLIGRVTIPVNGRFHGQQLIGLHLCQQAKLGRGQWRGG